jgi:hypothetical protein
MADKVKTVYAFIKRRFDDYDLERAKQRREPEWDFKSIEKFYKHQKACLKKLDETSLDRLIMLMKMIQEGGMMNMDKESMVSFSTSGFFFDKEEKLTVFNER